MNQNDLALLLGHKSKTYMSELMNGLRSFTLRDLIIIHLMLKVEMNDLIPAYLSLEDQLEVNKAIKQLNNPKLSRSNLAFS